MLCKLVERAMPKSSGCFYLPRIKDTLSSTKDAESMTRSVHGLSHTQAGCSPASRPVLEAGDLNNCCAVAVMVAVTTYNLLQCNWLASGAELWKVQAHGKHCHDKEGT